MLETWVGEWVVSVLGPRSGGLLCEGGVVGSRLVLRRMASLRSLVRRLSCLLSEFVRGLCIFRVPALGLVVPLARFSVLVHGMRVAW